MAAQAANSGTALYTSVFARFIPVRCLGSVTLSWVTDALSSGYDGIVLMGCQPDDDYQCHFLRGSKTAASGAARGALSFGSPLPALSND